MAHQLKTQRPFPLDSDEEVLQKVEKFKKNSNKSLRKTSVESRGKYIYDDCSQAVAEISVEAKDDLINDSDETEKNEADHCEAIREKDLEKVIKTHESKIPISIKTKSLLHGYPLPPGCNAKELQEKFLKHSDTRHAVSVPILYWRPRQMKPGFLQRSQIYQGKLHFSR